MPLPDFLIIGAQKAGTTWLAERLSQHPDIFMAPREIHFFDKDYNYPTGLGWYEQHFSAVEGESAIGEKTPDYLWANGQGGEGHLADVDQNIYHALPDVRLIVVLRNPVNRAISAVNHIIRSGRIRPVREIDSLLVGANQHVIAGHGVIEYGYYYQQLAAYQRWFRPEQFLILIFEENIVQSPAETLARVCAFLDVDPHYAFQELTEKANEYNSSYLGLWLNYYLPSQRRLIRYMDRRLPLAPAKLHPTQQTINELYALYDAENQKLFDLLGDEIKSWKR